jgi:alpha-beta hydrolase superfamily lysophospholipase
MSDLSSAAQAILKAAYKATRNPKWQTNFYTSYAAAVLRAAADQVVPDQGDVRTQDLRARAWIRFEECELIRRKLLAIADELEVQ